jgi:hypothetical protein
MVILKKQFTVKLILFGLFLSTKGTEINAVSPKNKPTRTRNLYRKITTPTPTPTPTVIVPDNNSKGSSINYFETLNLPSQKANTIYK